MKPKVSNIEGRTIGVWEATKIKQCATMKLRDRATITQQPKALTSASEGVHYDD